MHRIQFLPAALTAIAIAACSGDAITSSSPGAVLQPPIVVASTSRGAVIARDLCAQCHGENFGGAASDDGVCPTLQLVQNYTLAEFERLIVLGVSRGGDEVDYSMSATQTLSEQDRQALYQYLKERFPDF